uniref:Transmembrane protein n=1 Tax=Trichobilharzia regenti TaxID=157069 RepID=A0AA85KHH4_TRIRE|nr:unnamed protein product [Trichobilharzia regenti]
MESGFSSDKERGRLTLNIHFVQTSRFRLHAVFVFSFSHYASCFLIFIVSNSIRYSSLHNFLSSTQQHLQLSISVLLSSISFNWFYLLVLFSIYSVKVAYSNCGIPIK